MLLIRNWRLLDCATLAVLLIAAVAASFNAWKDIFSQGWHDPEQSHVLLAIPVAAWLFWLRRGRMIRCKPKASVLGPIVILAAWGVGELGLRHSRDVLWHFSALLLLLGCVLSVAGYKPIIKMAVPAVALLFLLPVPALIRLEIAQPLQEISARCSQYLLDLFGVPVVRTGNALIINGHNVVIAEACNGMRMVAALFVVTYTFAFSIPARPMVRALLLASSPLLAVVVNILRLMPTVMFYGYTSESTATAFHDLSGWFMMVIALLVLWSIMRLLRWMELPVLNYGAMRE